MELREGMVVQSISGHDKGYFLVLRMEGNFLLLANGRQRLLEKPKRKNSRHVRATCTVFNLDEVKTNKKLRELLWPMNFGGSPTAE